MNIVKIIKIVFSLILGVMLILGGIKKFEKPSTEPTENVEKDKNKEKEEQRDKKLKIKNKAKLLS